MGITLEELNRLDAAGFGAALDGIYEHSPWVAAACAVGRPFASLAALKLALQEAVGSAGSERQLALIRAHPELAGKAAIAGQLSAESNQEQARAGLTQCSPEEFARLRQLNADYLAKFGFPFILAVKGPHGRGLGRAEIIASFARRLEHPRGQEIAENLRQIHRIAELRLNALFGLVPAMGVAVLDWAEELAAHSDDPGQLTCAYLTPAHRASAALLEQWMRAAGMETAIDAVGNVVGRYRAADPAAPTLITGSHYDTVRNGGKYDGRAGILLPIAVVRHLHQRGERLPYHLEVIAFAEEEGVRFKSTFLGSSAVAGRFDPLLLQRRDGAGISLEQALRQAGHDPSRIPAIGRDPAAVLGFVELHIEQGPVLLERGLPLGIVSSIAGSSRYLLELRGMAGHAGTTPMGLRRDAAVAAAEIVLLVESRCSGEAGLVGTVGQLQVPDGSVNVIPGRCKLSLDLRAPDDAQRIAARDEILAGIAAICARRGMEFRLEPVLEAAAVPCAGWLRAQLAAALERAGVPPYSLPSGAGHDAMMLAELTAVAMLFLRCGNGGISHNPLETLSADDAELAAQVLLDFLRAFAPPPG